MVKKRVADFILKILSIVEKYPYILRWSEDGLELVLIDKYNFINTVLPEVFRHRKYQSFVRQLNMYGFHKVSRHKDSTSFRHEHFYLGNEDNFNLIHRKRKEGEEEGSSQDEPAVEDTKMEIPAETAVSAIIAQFVAFKNYTAAYTDKLYKLLDRLGRYGSIKKVKNVKPVINKTKDSLLLVSENTKKIEHRLQIIKEHLESYQKRQLKSTSASLNLLTSIVKRNKAMLHSSATETKEPTLQNLALENCGYRDLYSLLSMNSVTHFLA